MTCPDCGPDEGILEICFDLDRVRAAWRAEPLTSRPLNQWRYRELLPLDPAAIPQSPGPSAGRPVLDLARLARELGVAQLLVKDDGRNPTASLKDRASAVGVVHAIERGATTIAAASTGNAATSLAGHAALAGLKAMIFVPKDTLRAQARPIALLSAPASSRSTATTTRPTSSAPPPANASAGTTATARSTPCSSKARKPAASKSPSNVPRRGGVPDWVAVGVGDGCTIAGIAKGLAEMHALGLIDRVPRMLGVQAATVAPLAYAFEHDEHPPENNGTTIAARDQRHRAPQLAQSDHGRPRVGGRIRHGHRRPDARRHRTNRPPWRLRRTGRRRQYRRRANRPRTRHHRR